jgi:hypothetical protein
MSQSPKVTADGKAVVSPFIFYGDTGEFTATVEKVKNPDPKSVKKISFNPSKDFNFVATADPDCNIDIYIHVNPKNLATSIPKIIGLTKKANQVLNS